MKAKHNRFIIAGLLFFLTLNLIYADDDVATALYKEGLKKYILKDYTGAITDFESALKLSPDEIKIKNMYINTLIKQGNIDYVNGNFKAAEKYFSKALTLSGENEELKKKLEIIKTDLQKKAQQTAEAKKAETEAVKAETTAAQTEKQRAAKTTTEVSGAAITAGTEKNKPAQISESTGAITGITGSELTAGIKRETKTALNQPAAPSASTTQAVGPAQLPFDINEFITRQTEENNKILNAIIENQRKERESLINENKKVLDKIMDVQQQERESLFNHMKEIARTQIEDRKFFGRSLLLILGAGLLAALLLVLGIFFIIRSLAKTVKTAVTQPMRTVGYDKNANLRMLRDVDETKYITNERYSDIEKAKRLEELYDDISKGNISFDKIQDYISELNKDVKSDVLSLIEKQITENKNTTDIDSTYRILLPLITDGESEINERSRNILNRLVYNTGGAEGIGGREKEIIEDPLSYSSIYNMALLADNKTGRYLHSSNVAEYSYEIANMLNESNINPEEIYKTGLAHDIGYLEIDDAIMKKKGELTKKEFAIIKTHPERGVRLLENIKPLPSLLYNGILYHHERLDGTGYPEGLTGDNIPIEAQIIAVADFFAASSAMRSYRDANTLSICFTLMEEAAGKILNKEIVYILINIIKEKLKLE